MAYPITKANGIFSGYIAHTDHHYVCRTKADAVKLCRAWRKNLGRCRVYNGLVLAGITEELAKTFAFTDYEELWSGEEDGDETCGD